MTFQTLRWPLIAFGALILVVLLLGYAWLPDSSRDIVARTTSPDGALDAVLVETNGGATTSFGYEILIADKGKDRGTPVAFLDGATRNQQAWGVDVRWIDDTHIDISYLKAESVQQDRTKLVVAGRNVTVSLHSGVLNEAAPAGGMLYNLKRHDAASNQ